MRKLLNISIAIFFIALLLPTNTIYGKDSNKIKTIESEDDLIEISALEDSILYYANLHSSSISRSITREDIDYSKMVKEYLSPEILSLDTIEESEIKKQIESSSYIWLLPIHIDTHTILISFNKPRPITDQEAENWSEETLNFWKESVGHWMIGDSFLFTNEIIDYNKTLENSLIEANLSDDISDVRLVGGL